MIEELERVILTVDIPEQSLQTGDVGTVVLVHGDYIGYEVEFVALTGETLVMVSVYPHQIRRIERGELAHARSMVAI